MTQVGEPASIGTVPDGPFIKGAVTRVTFDGSLRTFRNKSVVPTPHWESGADLVDAAYRRTWRPARDGSGSYYSKRPAVVKVPGAGGNMQVTVVVRISESRNISGTGKLVGVLGPLTIEGDCPLAAGTHTVAARITDMPDEIGWYRPRVVWGLEVPSEEMTVGLNWSFVELFAILDDPLQPAFSVGVWVEALRLVCEDAHLNGVPLGDKAMAAARVVRYCFFDHGLFYDCTSGAPSYGCGGGGGTFKLENYLKQASTFANCYDQAAAVQVLAGSVGVHLTWIYLEPFGYINLTRLLGWHVNGLCNSPFFDFDTSRMRVGRFDRGRTSFGNHAFCEYRSRIYDACAKPHPGSSDRAGYCSESIDSDPRLYGPRAWPPFPGRPALFATSAGVTAVT